MRTACTALRLTLTVSLGIAAAYSGLAAADEPAATPVYPVSDQAYSRELNSLSLQQVVAAGLDTGIYHGSPKVLADPKGYAGNFYNTLASRKRYLDKDRKRWEIVPIPQVPPPPCDQPQPTRYDAESCRYVNALFSGLEATSPEQAKHNREQVRRGRDVWFKGTFGNQDLYNIYLAEVLGGVPDYSSWLDTRNRDRRFKEFGLMNDPDCRPGSEKTFWLDDCDDPHASGVLGVRKYPVDPGSNPGNGFDPYASPYQDGEIVAQKRFVIGFSCALCHVAFDPTNPPEDPANPRWENLMGGLGNQYLRHGAMLVQNLPEDYFLRVVLEAARPGTSDTSLVSNDYIHNPGSINAIMNTHNRRVFEVRMKNPLSDEVRTARTRHVLKGGEDGVGEHLALMRVYVNTGLCAQECWTDKFPALGAMLFDTDQKPFRIKACSQKCEAWNHADAKMDDLLAYLITVGPTYLDKAVDIDGTPGGEYIDAALVPAGRKVFVENCARCHSSREIPEFVDRSDPTTMARLFDGHVFGGFHQWQRELGMEALDEQRRAALIDPQTGKLHQELNMQQDWLGNDELVAYHEIGTNRCRAIQTNHLQGHLWEEFSSLDYKQRKSPGSARRILNPLVPWLGNSNPFDMEEEYQGGRGYLRNISLLSAWSSAPLLHNNALGPFPRQPDGSPDYTVKGRVQAFDAAMQELLTSDNPDDSPHREAKVWRAASDIAVPAREDGKGLLRLTLTRDEPVGYMASIDPHHPLFSNCTDYVENGGHQFGVDLSKTQKTALIEFLKTL